MALPSNKSSSSPISGRANPSARNSEMGNPIRRSFTGNPFAKPSIVANSRGFNHNTPVNSPSEHLRRNSVGRDTIVTLRDYEDKENGKDQNSKPSKVRSPMKGTKNFMSPTISAASKITQSPKKKILAERSEPLRTSVTFSESKIPTFSQAIADSEHKEEDFTASLNPKTSQSEPIHETIRTSVSFSDSKIRTFSQTNADSERREEETAPLNPKASKTEPVHDSKEPLGSKNLPETLSELQNSNVTEETDSVNLDPSFKISPPAISYQSSSLFPTVAPLDSDRSMPPYDPKTNYLSPRPRFLHYRPNPRVELYLNREREGKRLDDSFISESFSDSDVTEETQSESSQKELEDVSSGEVVETKEKLEEEQEEEPLVSEPSPTFMSEEIDESSKEETRSRFFWWKKFIALLMVLSFACFSISITNSPVIDHSMFKGATFLKLYDHFEIAEFVRSSYDGLDRNLQVWSSKSMFYLAELISSLNGEKRKLGSLHYCNLTTLLTDDVKSNGYMMLDHDNEGSAEVITFGSTGGRDVHIEFLEEKGQPEIGDSKEIVDSFSEIQLIPEYEEEVDLEAEPLVNHNSPPSEEVHRASEFEVVEPLFDHMNPDSEKLHEAPESELVESQETDVSGQVPMVTESATNSKEEPVQTPQSGEVQSKVAEAVVELQDKSEISSAEVVPLKEAEDLTVNGSSDVIFSKSNVLEIAYWFLPLIAVAAFIFMKRRNDNNTAFNAYNNTATVQPVVTKKKLDYISTIPINPDRNTFEEKPASWNWVGESCPSEMSSFGTSSSSYSRRSLKGLNEAESHGRKTRKSNNNHRRESLASSCMDSSMGSPSYGSFTTYEKISSKNGYGDEETITPVRRSSRIRNLVTSP